jgi:alpha-tubulin suppressor-like RCC1 family protein
MLRIPHTPQLFSVVLIAGSLLAVSCGDSPTRVPVATELEKAGGDVQEGVVARALTTPLSVRVLDDRGDPMPDVAVSWTVTSGGGSLQASNTTNVRGVAEAIWTLGTTVGEQTVRAAADGAGAVSFTATAKAGPVSSLSLTPNSLAFQSLGQTAALSVQAADEFGNTLAVSGAQWSSTNVGVATVNGSGTVTAVGNGSTEVVASLGGVSVAAQVTVQQRVSSVTITPAAPGTLNVGERVQLSAEVRDANGHLVSGATIAWSSSNEAVARVEGAGMVSVVSEGTATIRATSDGVSSTVTITGVTPLPETVLPETITAGYFHSCGLTASGAAYCWGDNTYFQLGDGTSTQRTTPVAVQMPSGVTFSQITAGDYHTVALTASGAAYAWGYNAAGQLGDGSVTPRSTPVAVRMPSGVSFTQISTGHNHTVALAPSGVAYAWGSNIYGQLGDGTNTYRATTVVVSGGHRFSRITAGAYHNVALTADGTVYTWGSNTTGQLGDGTRTGRNAPVAVSGGHRFSRVSAGQDHTVALTASGVAYAWGDNTFGQLGDGTRTQRLTPVAVQMPSGVTFSQINAHYHNTVVLTRSGAAYAWGRNDYGQVGNGTTVQPNTPVAVAGGRTFSQVNVGGFHTLAITATGAAYTWGYNLYGQLGDGGTAHRSTPVAVSGGLTFQAP